MNERSMRRREFLVAGAGFGAALFAARGARAQEPQRTNFGPMDGTAYRATYRPPKPGATPSMTDLERDAFEKRVKCQCSCTLDVYTCRTTDFTCPVSPAMHADVMRLVAGGHTADEILDAFVETYGEVALMAPKKEGFNWAGYLAPGVALLTGGVVLTLMLRRWSVEARTSAGRASAESRGPAMPAAPLASDDELARLDRALRDDG